jgi:protein SCO1
MMGMGRAAFVVILSFALTVWVAFTVLSPEAQYHGMRIDPPLPAHAFTLESAAGPSGTEQLRGSWSVLFFGYATCPDVCPTTLARVGAALRAAGPRAEQDVKVLLVSVDPERDTPARLAEYTGAFGPQFTGVTGTPQEIARVASAYGIAYMRSPTETAAGYLVDHTSTLIVLNPRGEIALFWSPTTTVDEMASDMRTFLRR